MKDQDATLVEELRAVISGTKDKMQSLRAEIRERDRILFEEIEKRKDMERRLQKQLVDIYAKQPTINDELRQKLDLANRYDPFLLGRSAQQTTTAGTFTNELKVDVSTVDDRRTAAATTNTTTVTTNEARTSTSYKVDDVDAGKDDVGNEQLSRSAQTTPIVESEAASAKAASATSSPKTSKRKKRKSKTSSVPVAAVPFAGYAQPPAPLMSTPLGFVPYFWPHPNAAAVPGPFPPPPPMVPDHLSPMQSQVTMGSQRQSDSSAYPKKAKKRTMNGPIPMESFLPMEPAPFPIMSSLRDSLPPAGFAWRQRRMSDPGLIRKDSLASTMEPAFEEGFPPTGDTAALLATASSSDGFTVPEGAVVSESMLNDLLHSMRLLQHRHKQVLDRLASAEAELQMAHLSQQYAVDPNEVLTSNEVTDTLEKLHRAQREHDESMLQRLRVANEERDEALNRIAALKSDQQWQDGSLVGSKTLIGSTDEDNFPELLQKLLDADTVEQINLTGENLSELLRQVFRAREKFTQDQIEAVIGERDQIAQKLVSLRRDLAEFGQVKEALVVDRQKSASLQAKISVVEKERDDALDKMAAMEEELQRLTAYCTMHKSLSREESLRDQFNEQLDGFEARLHEKDTAIGELQARHSKTVNQLRQTVEEKKVLADELAKTQQAFEQSQMDCQKLERLVVVLRRKLSNADALESVE